MPSLKAKNDGVSPPDLVFRGGSRCQRAVGYKRTSDSPREGSKPRAQAYFVHRINVRSRVFIMIQQLQRRILGKDKSIPFNHFWFESLPEVQVQTLLGFYVDEVCLATDGDGDGASLNKPPNVERNRYR